MGMCNSTGDINPGAMRKMRKGGKLVGYVKPDAILEALNKLPQGKNVIAEYVWIDG